MGVLSTFVTSCQPAYYGGGAVGSGTEGASWKWKWTGITDATGTSIDFTTCTGTCQVLTAIGGSLVVALTFTGGVGTVQIAATPAATASLATGAGADGIRPCVWKFSITDATDTVQWFSPVNSPFSIYKGA